MSESMWDLVLELTKDLYSRHREKLTDEKEIIAWEAIRKCSRSGFKDDPENREAEIAKIWNDGFLEFSDKRYEQYHLFHNCKILKGETQTNIIADAIHQSHLDLCDILVEKIKQDNEIINIYALRTDEWYNMLCTDNDKLSAHLRTCKKSMEV